MARSGTPLLYNITDTILDYRNKWYEYGEKMKENCIPKRDLRYVPQGKKNV
jgi:hypothetical protein